MKNFVALVLGCSTLLLVVAAVSLPQRPQLIESLPGLDVMPDFKMYSGYLNAISTDKQLFYWLNEAEDTDSNKLIVWLQGDIGCSSMYGLFKEHGPFKFNDETQSLEPNEFSWNKFAHTLYLDTTVDTGFSYSESAHNLTEKSAVKHIDRALRHFMETLHPKYQNFEIYLAGQGNTARLLTALATRIMNSKKPNDVLKSSFSGLVLGNPQLSIDLNRESLPRYAFYNGLIGRNIFEKFSHQDCFNMDDMTLVQTKECYTARFQLQQAVFGGDVNHRNYGEQCWKTTEMSPPRNQGIRSAPGQASNDDDDVLQRRVDKEYECLHFEALQDYLSQRKVQEAIHARNIDWNMCSAKVLGLKQVFPDVSDKMLKVLEDEDKRVLLYYGNQDVDYNYVGGEMFINHLELLSFRPRAPLIMDHGNKNAVIGMFESFDNLDYAIIFGAGQSAPKDKPEEVSMLVEKFVNDRSFSSPADYSY